MQKVDKPNIHDVLQIMYKHKCRDGSQRTDKMSRKMDKSTDEVLAETIDKVELLRKPCEKCAGAEDGPLS